MTAPGRARWVAGLTALSLVAAAPGPVATAPVKGLTQVAAVLRVFDLVHDADFAAAEAELARACGPAPRQACDVVDAASLWWRIYLDIDNRSLDQQFLTRIADVIARGEQWAAREPDRAEAWFYLGAAYGARVQYHAQRAEYLSAARDGKRIKSALEKALSLDPDMQDANFGIGMYEYYADIAPTVLKLLRWLLALPGGDKVKGLGQMQQTRNLGTIMRSEAAYQLHLVYIWYEKNPEGAIALLEELRGRHPHNPIFQQNIAEVHDVYRGDRLAALAAYRVLADGGRHGTFHEPGLAEAIGHLGAAEQLDALAEPDRAIDEWRAVIDRNPAAPYGAVARAYLGMGRAYDRLGDREKAVAAYRAAQQHTPPGDPRQTRQAAQNGLSVAPDRNTADACRLSLEGWRAFQRGALADAATRLDRAVQRKPDDGVHRYRRGMVLEAQGDRARAIADFEHALQVRPSPPAPFMAGAFLESGRLYEAAGNRARAVASYEWVARVQGADPSVREAAAQALARLRR